MNLWIACIYLLSFSSLFANYAYVGNGSTTDISIINTDTNEIVDTIPIGTHPILIAITPNNLYAYVTANNDSVVVIETSSNSPYASISLPAGSDPIGVAITPNGQFVYVADQGTGMITVISTVTNQIVDSVGGFSEPWGIAITPDGQFAYVVNGGTTPGFVSIIDLSNNSPLPNTIQVGDGPTGIAITPNGQYAYVTNENSDSTSVISIANNSLAATIPVGINPFEVTASPNSQYVYVANNAYTSPSNSSVSVISTTTNDVVATIPMSSSSGPAALAVTPDGQTLYVTNTVDIALFSTATNQPAGSIPLISNSIAITNTLISNLTGRQEINDFGVVYEYFNHLQWQPVPYSDVIGYNVYRNGSLIAELNANTFQYNDHNQRKNVPVTYMVAPVEASGVEGTPLSVVIS